jgi:peroxiredoxin
MLIKEWRPFQRAVFVIDRHDRMVSAAYVADHMREPDYSTAMQAICQAFAS